MIHQNSTQGIAHHINGGAEAIPKNQVIKIQINKYLPNSQFPDLQQPIHGYNEGHILRLQADSVQHHDHGDQTRLWNARGSNGGSRGRYAHSHNGAEGVAHLTVLSNEQSSHCLIESGSIHVDGGAHGDDEAGDPRIYAHVVQTLDGQWHGGRAGASTEGRGQDLTELGNVAIRQTSGAQEEDHSNGTWIGRLLYLLLLNLIELNV